MKPVLAFQRYTLHNDNLFITALSKSPSKLNALLKCLTALLEYIDLGAKQ